MSGRAFTFWVLLLVWLQGNLWFGTGSLTEAHHLHQDVRQQQQANAELQDRNNELAAEVSNLKTELEAIEEIARYDLIMTRKGETFYQIIEKDDEP